MTSPVFRVRAVPGNRPSYEVVGRADKVEPAVQAFLLDLLAGDRSPATIRTYAFALCSWLNFLDSRESSWQEATPVHLRDFVLHLRAADNPHRARHRPEAPSPGSINARTGKPYLAAGYKPATINARLSVIQGFHAFQEQAAGLEPASKLLTGRRRRNTHHNPLEPWTKQTRGRFRQRQPRRLPRALGDDLWAELFASLEHDRDRAILCLLVSSAARAQELLDMRGVDVDWAGQCVCLTCKGTRHRSWVAASPEFFRWLASYLVQRGPVAADAPLWMTLRAPIQPLGYTALRAIFTRVNQRLGTNVTAHDLRHTCALRLAADPAVPLVHIQTHLRHQSIGTTQLYLIARTDEVVTGIQTHLTGKPSAPAAHQPGWTYDPADLQVLLGPDETLL
ncbi:MAG: site-specific integrase [Acetobacteraceae bacterium]|nr:site-specific integrase [Acetobacteraceae bacterium]